jgi:hypothetical protein
MKKYDFILGIDPDSEKSGVTILNTQTKEVQVSTLPFPQLIEFIITQDREKEDKSLLVVVEAGWLIMTNWHTSRKDNHRVASAIGNRVGRNQETGRKIVEMCKYMDVEVKEIRPLKKFWRGSDGKITQAEISQFIPDYPKRSNQEERDSTLIAWYYAGLPIKVGTIKN